MAKHGQNCADSFRSPWRCQVPLCVGLGVRLRCCLHMGQRTEGRVRGQRRHEESWPLFRPLLGDPLHRAFEPLPRDLTCMGASMRLGTLGVSLRVVQIAPSLARIRARKFLTQRPFVGTDSEGHRSNPHGAWAPPWVRSPDWARNRNGQEGLQQRPP